MALIFSKKKKGCFDCQNHAFKISAKVMLRIYRISTHFDQLVGVRADNGCLMAFGFQKNSF